MRLTNNTLLYGGLGVLAGLLAYNTFLRTAGDKVRVGDEVLVPPAAIGVNLAAIPQINARTEFVVVKVSGISGNLLQGQVIGAQGVPSLPLGPPVQVAKSAVIRTIREGRVV